MAITNRKKLNIRTKKGVFGIVLETWDNESGYVVRVPKFPEIVTQGENIAEAKKMAREAIELCIECQKIEEPQKQKISNRISHVQSI